MTQEKRKRGRPPGSGKNKPKINPILAPAIAELPAKVQDIFQEAVEAGRTVITPPQEPFPKDWNTMGKVDRLRWLTENKR